MNISPLNPKALQNEVSQAINYIASYYENVHTYPVRSQVEPGYLKDIIPENAPCLPQSLEEILEDVDTKIVPGLTHWQSPNFYAFFPATASNAGLVGELLCSGLNVVGFNWISSPAATELETIVIDWMGKLLNLPQDFLFSHGGGGVIHGSTCEAVVCTLAAGRDEALKIHGEEKITKLVVYASDQTHFTFQKAAKLVGIPPRNFKVLPTSSHTDFALSPDVLRAAIEADISQGFIPLYVCATVGATASGAIDPIDGLGHIAREFRAWLHVDAAFAGSACICPEFRHYLNGVELANSISMNPHKWLLSNMDCTCLWLRNPKILVDSLSTKPEILKNKDTEFGDVIDYKDWQIALSRRFRALKLWIVIRRYGSDYLMSHIRSDVMLAKYFESLVINDKDKRFELVVPRKFSLVCFRLKPIGDNGNASVINTILLEAINSSGQAYMSHAVIGDKFAIRCAIGGSLTQKCHIDSLWKLIQEKAQIILVKNEWKTINGCKRLRIDVVKEESRRKSPRLN